MFDIYNGIRWPAERQVQFSPSKTTLVPIHFPQRIGIPGGPDRIRTLIRFRIHMTDGAISDRDSRALGSTMYI